MINILLLVVGLISLIAGGNWLLKAAVASSLKLQIPKIVIGMTVVSFATSAPELIVSVRAAIDGFPDLSLGNVVGSNIANLGLVLGITVMFGAIHVTPNFYKTDWPMMMLTTLLFFGFIYFDQELQFWEGATLVSMLVLFIGYLIKYQKQAVVDEMPEDDQSLSVGKITLFFVVGGTALWAGSELLIKGAVGLAESFGVSERIIGITVVSVGTSIPELAASVIAVLKKEKAISIGNLLGSNIFNIMGVLGITALITPIRVQDLELLNYDIFWMLGISFLILPLVFFPKGLRLGWRDGIVLLLLYGIFIYQTIG